MRPCLSHIQKYSATTPSLQLWMRWWAGGGQGLWRDDTIHATVSIRIRQSKQIAKIIFRGFKPPLFHFLLETSTIFKFNLLVIRDLDLSREHQSLSRIASLSSSITELCLISCATESAIQLGRFITSFPSVTELEIESWSLPPSGLRDAHIRRNYSQSSLYELDLRLTPNISGLLDYFIKARPFVTHLARLTLKWECVENIEQYRILFTGVSELFRHCSQHLEWLWIDIEGSESRLTPAHSLNLSKRIMETISFLQLILCYSPTIVVDQFIRYTLHQLWRWRHRDASAKAPRNCIRRERHYRNLNLAGGGLWWRGRIVGEPTFKLSFSVFM